MRLEPIGIEITGCDERVAWAGEGEVAVGPFVVDARVEAGSDGPRLVRWAVANRGDASAAPVHVRLVWGIGGAAEPLRFFRHGYQSWSPSGVATFGVDADPSVDSRTFEFVRDAYLGDPSPVTGEGELRSSLVTVLRGRGQAALLVGFAGGHGHDGTLRLRRGAGGAELVVEAFLGGAELPPGSQRALHDVLLARGDDPAALLESWAATVGDRAGARTDEPYQIGWCSWYHYFHDVTEDAFRANLARAGDWPFAVFQLDDGYQSEIGDWLVTESTFPSPLETLAADVAAAGRRPGLWLAPFLAAPASQLAASHPGWLSSALDGSGPLPSWFNPPWGGIMWGLDTTRPEVQDHLEGLARTLVGMGFTYLKLDFTMSPGLHGRFHDVTATPAERVRAGYDAIRRGAGDDTFLLGCGAPIGPCIGVVDGMRIGPDVAPSWTLPTNPLVPALADIEPATRHAYRNTLTRSFQHRRLWLNDPDCLMLRTAETSLTPEQARTWAHVVGVSGGMALVSDDLALLGPEARALLDDVVAMGRAADDAARRGRPAVCRDLLDSDPPRFLAAAGYDLATDPGSGTSELAIVRSSRTDS